MAEEDVVRVDTVELRAMAGRLAEVDAALGKAVSGRSSDLKPLAPASWVTVDAVKAAEADWHAFVHELTSSVSGVSADLRSAADSYEWTDLDAARRLRQGRRSPG